MAVIFQSTDSNAFSSMKRSVFWFKFYRSLSPRVPLTIRHHQRCKHLNPWWRHQIKTFSASLALCVGNSPVPGEFPAGTGEFPAQRPVTRSFDVLLNLRLNKRLSKQSWGWWFEKTSRPFWRHCNAITVLFTEVYAFTRPQCITSMLHISIILWYIL